MSPPLTVARGTRCSDFAGQDATEALKAAAATILTNCGFNYGPNRINRLVMAFRKRVEGNGFAFFDFLANSVQLDVEARRRALANPDIQRVISYSDPTGETAVANVMRGHLDA